MNIPVAELVKTPARKVKVDIFSAFVLIFCTRIRI